MQDHILRMSGRSFKRFVSCTTNQTDKPTAKFIGQLLCGMLFCRDLILTHVSSRVPDKSRLTAIAKRFRRQLANTTFQPKRILLNYLSLVRKVTDLDSSFIVDLTDLAKPYAKKMENIGLVRDADQDKLVNGYWCVEVYCIDRRNIIWPLILWPYSLEAEGQVSENQQILKVLSILDEYFGSGFGIYIFDRGFDRISLIEPFLSSRRHFIIRQRGDRAVVLANGVRMVLSDLVEHLFAQSGSWIVWHKVYLPNIDKPLYVVAYRSKGKDEPVILLTDMVVEDFDTALQIRGRYTRRWRCETSTEFLKSQVGIERFAVRKYKSMQRLIFLAALAMGFLSYLQSCHKDIAIWVTDKLRYSRQPKSFWFYRVLIALQDAFNSRARVSLGCWCRAP